MFPEPRKMYSRARTSVSWTSVASCDFLFLRSAILKARRSFSMHTMCLSSNFSNPFFPCPMKLRQPSPIHLHSAFPPQVCYASYIAISFNLEGRLDPTLPALYRIRRYLRSAGRYGPSPFLIGHYGGAGEISQGFCRAAAVSGGVYILGRKLTSAIHTSPSTPNFSSTDQRDYSQIPRYSFTLEGFSEKLTANAIVSSLSHVPLQLLNDASPPFPISRHPYLDAPIARCIAIIDQAIRFPAKMTESADNFLDPQTSETRGSLGHLLDAGILVFPPSTVEGGSITTAATVLVTGEGTMSTPVGKCSYFLFSICITSQL